jgi:ribonucleoside-diphosphate reductase alpha chain
MTMPASSESTPLVQRYFTKPGVHPYDEIIWEKRSSKIVNDKGATIFELNDAEIPSTWAQLATDIVVSKYFRKAGVPETGHEVSVKQVVHRIAHNIRNAALEFGDYFDSETEANLFEMELTYLLSTQRAAFNSPVWFNCGLYQDYNIKGGTGNWYWNFDKGGVEQAENNYVRPQCSACFIQSAEDDLMSMFDLMKSEVRLFKYGSGTGSNFSKIRGKGEKISAGGTSSGLLSFLKVFDSAAGSIKSGGTTRRAAKMVCLDMEHPDIVEFINWKVTEEKKVAALIAGGYSSDFNGEAYATVTAQNSNNSVRVTDEFMKAVEEDGDWNTIKRTNGEVMNTYKARDLWKQICYAAWKCADPGVQYDTTVNDWHTSSNTDRIHASNPCSEYMFLDDSACNLASINLIKFLDEDGSFDIEGYRHACRIMFIAQEILVDFSSYPTQPIAKNSHDYRPLGLGYANIGTLLMCKGIPYDSPEACAITGALTAIMTGRAYRVSAEMAARKGTFNGFEKNRKPMLKVMNKHRDAAYAIDAANCPESLLKAAQEDWDDAVAYGEKWGYRNAQATVIAPTGTIGLLMDCDTTSIEPDFALVKFKKLAGGGHFKIVNQSVPVALKNLDYTEEQIEEMIRYATGTASLKNTPFINEESLSVRGVTASDLVKVEKLLLSAFELQHVFNQISISQETLIAAKLDPESFTNPNFNFLKALGFSDKEIEEATKIICGMMTLEGAPYLKEEHLPVFDCANKCGRYGTRFIEPMGHVRIMAAAQPFISGAISKTVNLPFEATEEEISQIYFDGWKLGLKAIAMYRDGSKYSQPLNSGSKQEEKVEEKIIIEKVVEYRSERRRLPDERQAVTHKFAISGHEGYITVGMFEDGTPGEIFITMAKQGSVISGLMDSFATSISIALQYNVPLEVLVNKFSHVRFEPSGMTNNPNIRIAKSIVDYVFRWLGMKFLDREAQVDLGYNLPKSLEGESVNQAMAAVQVAVDAVQEKVVAAVNSSPTLTNQSVRLEINKGMTGQSTKSATKFKFDTQSDAPSCGTCGGMTVRNGSCYLCRDCGATSGCS